jgi:signal peptidase I
MKKTILYALFGLFFLTLTAFGVHKFYVSIYQINYASEKKMLQITSRIFVDDLNDVLHNKFNKKTHLGEVNESPEDVILMKKYLLDNFFIKVNGQQKSINYLSKEFEGNVIICYYNVKDVSKIKTLEVQNKVLLDLNSDQQNIIQTTIYGKKQNLLLTNENTKGMLKQ